MQCSKGKERHRMGRGEVKLLLFAADFLHRITHEGSKIHMKQSTDLNRYISHFPSLGKYPPFTRQWCQPQKVPSTADGSKAEGKAGRGCWCWCHYSGNPREKGGKLGEKGGKLRKLYLS